MDYLYRIELDLVLPTALIGLTQVYALYQKLSKSDLKTPLKSAPAWLTSCYSGLLLLHNLPSEIVRKLPRHKDFPAILIGCLAIVQRFQNQGYGGILLLDALHRCQEASKKIGAMAVIVEGKDDNARSFYEGFGFRKFEDIESNLFMPMTEIKRI